MKQRKWIHVDGLIKEITDVEDINHFNVDFDGECMMEITKIDGVPKVTNAMNGYGINCLKFLEDKEVIISVEQSKNITTNKDLSPQEIEFYDKLDRWDKEAEMLFTNPKPTAIDHFMNVLVEQQSKSINATNPDNNLSRLEVLRQINYEIEALSDEDADGHIWWNRFREMIEYL
jgi:hypothetical protein